MLVEFEKRIAWQSGLPELVDRNYEELCPSHIRVRNLFNFTKMCS